MARELLELEIMKRAVPCLAYLEAQGFQVVSSDNFMDVERRVAETKRTRQNPMMSIRRNDFTSESAFWLFLEQEGKTIAGVSAKFENLGTEPFDAYLRRTSRHQYDRHADPITHIARPVAEEIKGRLIYIGELEFHPDFRGQRTVFRAFIRLHLSLAAMKWDFDWFYAYLPDAHISLTSVYSFTWVMPEAITWRDPVPAGRQNDHWMIGFPRKHFEHVWGLSDEKIPG